MHLYFVFIFVLYNICYVWSGAIEITSSNIESILSSNEIVFINFYASWCRFSQMLNPIFDEFAVKVTKEYPQTGVIAIGRVDCDKEPSISTKYRINKYPTMKLFRHGILTKREYRGARQVDVLFDYIRKQIQSSIINLTTQYDLRTLDPKKRFIIGHFNDTNSSNYRTFSKVANLLRDECHFAASTNSEQFKSERPTNDVVYYHSVLASNGNDQYYLGLIDNEPSFYTWSHEKCSPLIREITFENAEELTDEGLPFLILFHRIDDYQSLLLYEREVAKQLMHERSTINCLHADGIKFNHPLTHIGKTEADLPLLVIDSFKHMFLFPDIHQISHGKLLQFVKDLHSGKLHQNFHNPPSPPPSPPSSTTTTITVAQENIDSISKSDKSHIPRSSSSNPSIITSGENANKFLKEIKPSSPPESVFIHLVPSRQRYSFRDEL